MSNVYILPHLIGAISTLSLTLVILLLLRIAKINKETANILRAVLDNTDATRFSIMKAYNKNTSVDVSIIDCKVCDYRPPLGDTYFDYNNFVVGHEFSKLIKQLIERPSVVLTVSTKDLEYSILKQLLMSSNVTIIKVFAIHKSRNSITFGFIEFYDSDLKVSLSNEVTILIAVNKLRNLKNAKWIL